MTLPGPWPLLASNTVCRYLHHGTFRRMRSLRSVSFAALVAAAAIVPSLPAAASPDLSGFVPAFTQTIPFLSQGQSTTVGGVQVTATENTAVPGDRATTYLHQSNSRLRTVLTFQEPIPGFQAEVRLHTDCGRDACFEQYSIVGKDTAGTVVFQTTLRNVDGTFPYVPGSDAGTLSGLIATLEIDYTHDTPIGDLLRGSYLDLTLTDTYLEPARQTIPGTPGQRIEATSPFTPTGFAGAVTYSVTDGKLPAGLRLDPATGIITGTPRDPSNATITITATGATTGTATATITFDIRALQTVDVVADSMSLESGSKVPRIGFSTMPTVDDGAWTSLPVCRVYAADDDAYETPLSGVLAVGTYVTHCRGGDSTSFDIGSYSDGTFTITAAAAPPTEPSTPAVVEQPDLPATGVDPSYPAAIGALCIALGVLLVTRQRHA